VTESLPSNDPGEQKRRSTRIVQAVPITVTGVDALGQPFKERTTTVMVNCHGCKYQSKHYVPKNSIVTLEIARPQAGGPARSVQGRVVWVQRPRTVRELFQIGLEFEIAGNVWGIAFPPEDWFAHPDDEGAEIPAPSEFATAPDPIHAPPPQQSSAPQSAPAAPATPQSTPAPPSVSVAPPSAPAAPVIPPEAKIHVVPQPAQDAQAALAKQMSRMMADAKEHLDKTLRKGAETAITEEMTVVRQQLDAQLHDAVEKAIKVSMDRVSESAMKRVVQQAAERTASIVEEARKASEVSASQLDAKIRNAVEAAVTGATEQAAQQAAQQTAAHSLKEQVEQAVEHALRTREASTPSLEILSSPEAAQRHLDDWKKTLEDAAQSVRNQAVEQTSAEAAAAGRRWQEQFEAALSGATQKLGETLGQVSQAAVTQTEKDVQERSAALRASLDEAISGAASTIESLGAELKQERHRAEDLKGEIQQAAQATLEESRRRLDDLLSAQYQQLGRKADEAIAERAQTIEPTLEAAAQKVVERMSGRLEESVAPKLNQVQDALSQLAAVEQKAAEAESNIRRQMEQATEQAAQAESDIRRKMEQAAEQAAQAGSDIRQQMEQAAEQAARAGSDIRRQMEQAAEQAAQQASQIQTNVRDQIQRGSEQLIAESLGRLRQATEAAPAELEQKSRGIVAKIGQELEQKSLETEHNTYEALLKASDWYQKKAQTTMQSALERAVEQSTASLRDRAAEISSLLASELDHYRRTYVDHSAAQIEDAAKEVVERERAILNETAHTATAGFSDQVHRVSGESLQRFEHASRAALEKARSDMEFNRENSLSAFQEKLDSKLQDGIESAREQLQAQLLPLMQAWEANREAQQHEWMEQLKKSTDESIEQYKTRLENASNSWLLASATTLGQHSQTVLDTIAKAAEKRLRDTCAGVLAGMGDTLKQRLMGISTDFGDEEDDIPKKK
jgi:hypothetical protein